MDMEKTGREFLRAELKAKGEADTVEDMLRVGFHWPPLITVNHLHMHILYPIKDVSCKNVISSSSRQASAFSSDSSPDCSLSDREKSSEQRAKLSKT